MFVSLAIGFAFGWIYNHLNVSWIFSRTLLALTVIAFVPAGLVVLAHLRERLGWFGWYLSWDKSDTAWTTRRPKRLERVELVVAVTLWSLIALALLVGLFAYSHK